MEEFVLVFSIFMSFLALTFSILLSKEFRNCESRLKGEMSQSGSTINEVERVEEKLRREFQEGFQKLSRTVTEKVDEGAKLLRDEINLEMETQKRANRKVDETKRETKRCENNQQQMTIQQLQQQTLQMMQSFAQYQQAQTTPSESTVKIDRIQSKVIQLETSLKSTEDVSRKVTAAVDDLETKLKAVQQQQQQQQPQVENQQSQSPLDLEKLEQLETKVNQLEASIKSNERISRKIASAVATLDTKIKSQPSLVASSLDTSQIEDIQVKVGQLDTSIKSNERISRKMASAMVTLDTKIKAQSEQSPSLDTSHIEEIQAKVNQLDTSIKSNERISRKMASAMVTLDTKIKAQSQQPEQSSLESLQDKVSLLESSIKSNEKICRKMGSAMAVLDTKIKAQSQQQSESSPNVPSLDASPQIEEIQAKVNLLEASVKSNESICRKIAAAVSTLDTKLKAIQQRPESTEYDSLSQEVMSPTLNPSVIETVVEKFLSSRLKTLEGSVSVALTRIATLEEDFLQRQSMNVFLGEEDEDDSSSEEDSESDEEIINDIIEHHSEDKIASIPTALVDPPPSSPPRHATPAPTAPTASPSPITEYYSNTEKPSMFKVSPTYLRRGASIDAELLKRSSPPQPQQLQHQIGLPKSPIMFRRRPHSIEELPVGGIGGGDLLSTINRSPNKRSNLEDHEVEKPSPVPLLKLSAIPGFVASPKPASLDKKRLGLQIDGSTSPLRRSRSVSTNTQIANSVAADWTSFNSGVLMGTIGKGVISTPLKMNRKLHSSTDGTRPINFTVEELSVKKEKLRKVWEIIQEKEQMLFEKEKQLMLAEKERMISLYQIEPEELVICEEVGRGASAVVFRGFWNGTTIAIKALKKSSLFELDAATQGFFREIEILSSLRHPNIIQYYGGSITDDEIWMVLEFMPRGSLYDRLHHNKEDILLTEAFRIAKGIACGMTYLHSLIPPVIHLDLKSHNILLGPDYEPKVTDFGLSKLMSETGLSVGTPQWTAPELFEGNDATTITPKADVYSFGIVVYEIITRQVPWKKQNREAVPVLVTKKQMRPEIPASAPESLANLARQCWQHDPSLRPTFDRILDILDTESPEGTVKASPLDSKFAARQAARRKRMQSHIETVVKKSLESDYEINDEELYGGIVEGRSLKTNEKVAVKRIEKTSSNSDKDGKVTSLIMEDIIKMKSFDHPNIVKVFDVYEDKTHITVIMELLPIGDELFIKLIDKGQYSESYAQHVIKQIIKALDYLHANSVAHGALRPENVISSGDDKNEIVKLTNFGFSKLFEQEKDNDGAAYTAPELLIQDELVRYQPATDSWSLGILTYALLSGLPPFWAEDLEELIQQVCQAQYDFSDSDPWDCVSDSAKDFISRLLVKDPTKRLSIQQCKSHPWIKKQKIDQPLPTARGVNSSGATTPRRTGATTPRGETLMTSRRVEKIVFKEDVESDFEFGDQLGVGAYSIVLSARSRRTNEMFAIKCIDQKRLLLSEEGEDLMKFLKREITIMKRVDHPNIIKLNDVYKNDKQFYLVLEFVPHAEELFEKITKKGCYTESNTIRVVRQILAAIDYLHSNGIAHRDLKPENLMSSGDGETEIIKLTDFGFSKIFQGDSALKTAVGSPAYAAPELFTEGALYDKSVDMWALGVITYVLLCGFPPFYGETVMELLDRVMAVDYDFDDEIWEQISEEAKNFISMLLEKDPQVRLTARQCLAHPWIKELSDL